MVIVRCSRDAARLLILSGWHDDTAGCRYCDEATGIDLVIFEYSAGFVYAVCVRCESDDIPDLLDLRRRLTLRGLE